jgi:antirestriction protein ArdC
MNTKAKLDVYEIVTGKMIELLNKGVIPWERPWKGPNRAPKNLVSKKRYQGFNSMYLACFGYASQYWLTYKQAQDLGGNVKAGEKGALVTFWKFLATKELDPITGKFKRIPILRYYTVFNLEQCEGIANPEPETALHEFKPVEMAESIVEGMPKRPQIRRDASMAAYSPEQDTVAVPPAESFKTAEYFYGILFHELGHSTGAVHRLDRKIKNGFGSQEYAKEELIAEMTAAFLCAECGIERTIDNSAAYIQSWLNALENDKRLVVTAAGAAQKAANFILGIGQETEKEEETINA